LSSTSRVPGAPVAPQRPQVATLGWALRRAALGLLLLIVIVTLGAWLLWAGIDPDEASAAGAPGGGEVSAQR